MLPLRYPLLWLLPGWGLVAAVAVGSLTPGAVLPDFTAADKFVHGLAYFLLMVWFSGLYARRRHAFIALLLIVFGLGLELAQARLPYRWFDPLDLLANVAGVLLGLGLSFAILAGWCQRLERLLGYHD